jgi:NAD(P)-dependent dehydrogenase (short-subunit alcohol dehydrogenase family)
MAYSSMLDQGSGKVINLVSQPIGGTLLANAAYCASTFGLVGLTKVLAFRMGRLWHHGQQDQPDRALGRARPQGLA